MQSQNARGEVMEDETLKDKFVYDDDDGYILYVLSELYSGLGGSGQSEESKVVAEALDFARRFLSNKLGDDEGESFCFSLNLRQGDELKYVSLDLSHDEMEISSGGSVDMGCGHDTYDNVVWSISSGEHCEYNYTDVVSEIGEMLSLGATLNIE